MLPWFKPPAAAARALLQPFRALVKLHKFNKRVKHKRLFSGFDLLASSFSAMEVPNQLRQVFRLLDRNGDGKISPLELSQVLLWLGQEKSSAVVEAEGMVREVDCNRDGFIDLDEFMTVMINTGLDHLTINGTTNVTTDEDEDEDGLMEAFLIFDTDRNGLISAVELQRVLSSLGCAKCTLHKRMIKGVDRDGDGHVDFREFRSMMTGSSS